MNQETLRFFMSAAVFCFALFGAAVLLTGCSTVVECIARDATSKPCN